MSLTGLCQTNFSSEFKFCQHLIENGEGRDAVLALSQLDLGQLTPEQQDSFNYVMGWSYYDFKSLDTSAYYLGLVGSSCTFYHKSIFYKAFNHLYLGQYDTARVLFESMEVDSVLEQLRLLELAGLELLTRDLDKYSAYKSSFDTTEYAMYIEQQNLAGYKAELEAIKRKSPALAGFLSMILPGFGKWYAGYRGKAVASFLQVATLGGVAAENFFKAGLVSPQFIVFASLLSIVYMGNIWGSILSVKIKRNEKYRKIDHAIKFDLHIPLRRVFN